MTTETKNADTLTSSATDLAKHNYLIFVILSTERFIICKIGGEKLLSYGLKSFLCRWCGRAKESCGRKGVRKGRQRGLMALFISHKINYAT
ncbi:MAG: hypothetical protein D3925_11515 [Candidatus Electrothrix sp. AR5]|nr:hypothetical protein [Candidatus Electrothrix sp. AR5]